MWRLRALDRRVGWATLLAVLLATLAPGAAHALRHLRGDAMPWAVLCSANGGMRRIQLPDGPEPGQLQHAYEHCAACVLQLLAAPPPNAPATAVARVDLTQAAPMQPLRSADTRHAWTSAQPRAPPAC